jgi:hypothetical protein
MAFLSGCAPQLTSVSGQDLAKGLITPSPLASAVRVGSKANLLHQGKRLKFDVWIEADSSKGRLDALGPFGTPLATVIWQDSSWKAWLPGQGTLVRGTGSAINLPVLGLREVRPAALVAPLLGRTLPTKGPVRTVSQPGTETMVLPDSANPTWSLLMASNGLASRRSTLLHGREIEGLTFHRWKRYGDVLVPRTIDRTTPDGQLLQLEVDEWNAIAEVPTAHLQLVFRSPVDTITLTRNARGQPVYRIKTAVANGSDSVTVLRSETRGMLDAPFLETETLPEDSLLDSEADSGQDSTDVSDDLEDPLDEAPRAPNPAPTPPVPLEPPSTIRLLPPRKQ